mgnify:CR=1 FL=1
MRCPERRPAHDRPVGRGYDDGLVFALAVFVLFFLLFRPNAATPAAR